MCKLSRTVTLLLALILSFLILPVQAYALVDIESYIFDSLEQVDTDLFPLEYFAEVILLKSCLPTFFLNIVDVLHCFEV